MTIRYLIATTAETSKGIEVSQVRVVESHINPSLEEAEEVLAFFAPAQFPVLEGIQNIDGGPLLFAQKLKDMQAATMAAAFGSLQCEEE